MFKFLTKLPKINFISLIIFYTGFISFFLLAPITNILLTNESFITLSHWSFLSFVVCLLFFLVLPVIILSSLEHLLDQKKNSYGLILRWTLLIIGAIFLWSQMIEYYFNPLIKGAGLINNSLRYYGLIVAGVLFILIIFKFKKPISRFFPYLSPLAFICFILLLIQILNNGPLIIQQNNEILSDQSKTPPIYFLIFDGISLNSLLKDGDINQSLFPNFYQISQEWTWYKNAQTNATSTIPARSMLFSGNYHHKKSGNNIFKNLASSSIKLNISLTPSDILEKKSSKKISGEFYQNNLKSAITLNKSIFVAYLDISLPSPLRKYINNTPLKSWRFDWRGEVPAEYKSKENIYYGKMFKDQFFKFLENSTDQKGTSGNFNLLWSMISHFPYIFDENGNIKTQTDSSFRVNMSQEAVEKTKKNYSKMLQYVDSLIGIFIEHLKSQKLYNDSIIIITSDHGINPAGSNYVINDDVTNIPFFIKAPGLTAGPNERDVQIIDIAPTILNILELPGYEKYDGQSLLQSYQPREKIIYALGRNGFYLFKDGKWQHQY